MLLRGAKRITEFVEVCKKQMETDIVMQKSINRALKKRETQSAQMQEKDTKDDCVDSPRGGGGRRDDCLHYIFAGSEGEE